MKRKSIGLFGILAFAGIVAAVSCGQVTTKVLTVTFYAGFTSFGGLDSKEVRVNFGEKVSAQPISRSGYVLSQWDLSYDVSSQNGIGTAYDFETPVTSNFTLFAEWSKEGANTHTGTEVDEYMKGLAASGKKDHLYIHYFRFGNKSSAYSDWDVWCWPYAPTAGEGMKFDWAGRTQNLSSPTYAASGDATTDSFGGAYVDIDLTKTYRGGWDSDAKTMGGSAVSYYAGNDPAQGLDSKIGFQIVRSSTRTASSSDNPDGFWANDGHNQFLTLDECLLKNASGENTYHVFCLQDNVSAYQTTPIIEQINPFDGDTGTNVTYGNSSYNTANWSDRNKMPTSPEFLKGSEGGAQNSVLKYGAGVGYQIMVASFADSDGDGFGDIYGVTSKLDYLKNLGVNVLWLTPIQKSDSYHGYDIVDYGVVDPKFGSSASPAGVANGGVVDEKTAKLDYKELLDAAHSKGMTVIMDLVLNHTSTGNKWFIQSAQLNKDYRAFYQWGDHDTQTQIKEANSWYPYGDHVYSYYAKFGSGMPELNYMYAPTREAVFDMANSWCDFGVDGFRLDAVKHVFLADEIDSSNGDAIIKDVSSSGDYSSNLTKNLNFFKELNFKVKSQHPNAFFVGENFDGHAYHVAPYYEGFDSMFDFRDYFDINSAAATGRQSSTNAFGTAQGLLQNAGTYSSSGDSNLMGGKTIMQEVDGNSWNLQGVLASDAHYRGDSAINGAFTSNHDIARCINRLAGTGNANGIQAQGNVDASTYDSYEQSANCVKIAQLMLPGCTWIYYGDELGMTGNFPSGTSATSDYSDLWYRQPMKWKQGGAVGDGHYTCGYNVTGSGVAVSWDAVNASSKVMDAETQVTASGSQYNILKDFAVLKSQTPALIRGSLSYANYASGNLAANVLCFTRTLDGTTYKVAVNFNNSAISVSGLGSTVAASFNGATAVNLPAFSAIVTRS